LNPYVGRAEAAEREAARATAVRKRDSAAGDAQRAAADPTAACRQAERETATSGAACQAREEAARELTAAAIAAPSAPRQPLTPSAPNTEPSPTGLPRMFNAFAAHLLMPRSSVLSIWDEFSARSPRLAAIAVAVRFSVSWTAACNQLKNLGLIDSWERERLLGDDLRRGELLEFGERFAVELDPPGVPPAYARAVVSAYRKGQLTAARTVELLHHSVGEADLPEPDAMSLDELRGEFETGL
jgi:hypothetical protein